MTIRFGGPVVKMFLIAFGSICAAWIVMGSVYACALALGDSDWGRATIAFVIGAVVSSLGIAYWAAPDDVQMSQRRGYYHDR